jgi:carboxyl-terminal processing protease
MKFITLFAALVILVILAMQAQAQTKTPSKQPPPQPLFDAKKVVDSAIFYAKAIALNSVRLSWDSIRSRMHEKAFDVKSVTELKKPLEFLLTSLGDNQALFFDRITNAKLATLPGNRPADLLADAGALQFEMFEHNIRYLRLVAVPSGKNLQEEAEKIRFAVDSLMKGDAHSWIVDLRFTADGDMNPLFAGVAPILDEGLIATTIDNAGKIHDMYTVHNANFYINQVRVGKFAPHNTDLRNAKVAVLTSRYTSGAAEVLAIALRGKKHTRIFGEATAGNVFGLTTIRISKDVGMQLSKTLYVNKKGIEYRHPLDPDKEIPFTRTDSKADEAIKEAIHWLRSEQGSSIATN